MDIETTVAVHRSGAPSTHPNPCRFRSRWSSIAAVALAGPLILVGCAESPGDEPADDDGQEAPEETSAAEEENDDEADAGADSTDDSAADEEETSEDDDAGDGASVDEDDDEDAAGSRGGLPDPEETLDVERTEELGAFFSEEEACMTVGSTADGLRGDMDIGLQTEDDIDGAYEAVEQTYLLVPEDLRGPFENIAQLLEVDHDDVDAEAVLTELEPIDLWIEDACDGQYHQQDVPGEGTDDDADEASSQG